METIRTGAMRVIHIPVKTEETQRLRIKFVLYCPMVSRAKSMLFLSVVWWINLCGGSWVVLSGRELMRMIGVGIFS